MNDPLEYKMQLGRSTTLGSYGLLIALFCLVNAISELGSVKLLLVQTVPLLILLPGLWSNKHRSYIWLCFILLMYFTIVVVNIMSPPELVRWYHYVELVLVVVMFIAAMMTSRWIQQWRFHQPNADPSD